MQAPDMQEQDESIALSADDVVRQVKESFPNRPSLELLNDLACPMPFISISGLNSGYGNIDVLHDINLAVAKGQSLCLIGPNGAGKSTILHSIYGFTDIRSGTISIDGRDITGMSSNQKLRDAGIAYVLQHNSVFPDMTVEENLWMGGFLKDSQEEAKEAANLIMEKYDRLRERRNQKAGILSGGERRLLEISRALIMNPQILLVDEPSIGLEPRFIDMVFEILGDLQHSENKTIIMVEQNAKKGLEFSDIGYVLVSGQVVKAGSGVDLLEDAEVGSLFLGGGASDNSSESNN